MLIRSRGGGVRVAALVGLAWGLSACGSSLEAPSAEPPREGALTADVCRDIAREYAEALPEALRCEPATDSCAARRPLVIYLVEGSQQTLEGLSHCAAPVNAARTARLDELLGRYAAAGCELRHTPCLWNQHSPETDAAPPCRLRPDGAGSCNG